MVKRSVPTQRESGPKIWLYMVDGRNNQDLAKLDTDGFDTWRGHPQTLTGDLILMYRTAPYSDLAYIFTAISDARPTRPSQRFPWKHAVDLGRGFRLRQTIKLAELKSDRRLAEWSFLSNQQGATSRTMDLDDQGAWPSLRKILQERDPGSREYIDQWRDPLSSSVFLSYASPDKAQVQWVYRALRRAGIEVWIDRNELLSGHKYNQVIKDEINSCRAMVVCMSKRWLKRPFAQKELEWALSTKASSQDFLFPIRLDNCVVPQAVAKEVHIPLISGPGRNDRLKRFASRLRSILESKGRSGFPGIQNTRLA